MEERKDARIEKIESLLFMMSKTVSNIPIYGTAGPQFGTACKKLVDDINDFCFLHGKFAVGETGGKLRINDAIIEMRNPAFEKFVMMLKSHFMSSIGFSSGVEQEEIEKLIKMLNLKAMGLSKEDVEGEVNKAEFKHICVNNQSIELVLDGGFDIEGTPETDSQSSGRGKKILVVEDNEKLRNMYKEELSEKGYEVKLACDGCEAMGVIEGQEPPDLLVLDIKMAGMSGVELLQEMTKKKILLPVVVATAYPAMTEDVTVRTFPNVEMIIKPFSYDNLSRIIGRMLAKA